MGKNTVPNTITKIIVKLVCFTLACVALASHSEAKEWKKDKIAQFGLPVPLPQSRTTCVNWASGDLPFGAGWRTCIGHRTEWRTRQYSVYLVVHGPEDVEEVHRAVIAAAVAFCAKPAYVAGKAAFVAVPADPASKIGSAALAAAGAFAVCMQTNQTLAGISAAVTSKFSATVVGREFWGGWG